MRMFIQRPWLVSTGAVVSALLTLAPGFVPLSDAFSDSKPARTPSAEPRTVSFLKEVRPILAQHCFQCHGPDEAARTGKLRLDLKEHAFAHRKGQHVIAPGNLQGSQIGRAHV